MAIAANRNFRMLVIPFHSLLPAFGPMYRTSYRSLAEIADFGPLYRTSYRSFAEIADFGPLYRTSYRSFAVLPF
ncbi:hypothetical protein [Paenibacillus sp. UNC496MF]|uniref:hypothetical protein n=1 Tax=Paenibacillus sp. UNC496MF TaxID=1502753 RepID=UPI001C43151B|nr:hypothetical protein [Paenibacillus sp. UNC496MF]